MRSEKEGGGGPRVAVVARGPSGREKALPAEIQICQESLRREPDTPLAPSSGSGGNGGKPREEKRTVLSKVVVRRLPPSLTREQLEEQLQPLPAHDYFEFFTADLSLYPHLYSRAYINFRNPDDILLFRDRFDGYIFIDSKDPEYKKFLETYCVEEEKAGANPETLLGDVEAKTRELIARRTTPLLEYIKNRKLEKQRIREEKREERRRRELEKKRLREEEKRRRREEERCKKKAAEKQKKTAEKEVRVKLLKKPEKGEEPGTENPKEGGEAIDFGGGSREPGPSCAGVTPRPSESSLEELPEPSQNDSDKEQRDMERRCQEKQLEAERHYLDDNRRHRAHSGLDKFSGRSEEEPRWGRGFTPDRGKRGSQDGRVPVEAAERPGRERSDDGLAPRRERLGNKDRLGSQPYQPRTCIRALECGGRPSEGGRDGRRGEAEDSAGAAPKKSEEAEPAHECLGNPARPPVE
ncbi:regulator of nonsense transcripts 3A isoform X4 [Phacochoerus africanus]|uniref:regulator of nonsense transcripts 3A isoform X4 n=1 Tax=Phacochoerus africanus TaxID=41426 RepID=UPI001FDA1FCB|nr:regulator of nonsense transcripts 3A isoform X4 [Phacochoerus africanus]